MPSGDFEGFSECAALGVADGASPTHRAGTLSLTGRMAVLPADHPPGGGLCGAYVETLP